jgi:hypothetical protein
LITRREKEHEDMGRFLQGELPKDDIKFAENTTGSAPAETTPAGGMDMQFMRL